MVEKLKALSQKYDEIEFMLSRSEVWADAQKAAALSREKAELAPLMEAYGRYEAFRQEAESAEALLSDPEMRDLARETLDEARAGMERTAEELKILLLPMTRTTEKTSSWRSAAASAARRARCLPPIFSACTPCTPSGRASRWRS